MYVTYVQSIIVILSRFHSQSHTYEALSCDSAISVYLCIFLWFSVYPWGHASSSSSSSSSSSFSSCTKSHQVQNDDETSRPKRIMTWDAFPTFPNLLFLCLCFLFFDWLLRRHARIGFIQARCKANCVSLWQSMMPWQLVHHGLFTAGASNEGLLVNKAVL